MSSVTPHGSSSMQVLHSESIDTPVPGISVSEDAKKSLVNSLGQQISTLQRSGASDEQIDSARQRLIAASGLLTHSAAAEATAATITSEVYVPRSRNTSSAPIATPTRRAHAFREATSTAAVAVSVLPSAAAPAPAVPVVDEAAAPAAASKKGRGWFIAAAVIGSIALVMSVALVALAVGAAFFLTAPISVPVAVASIGVVLAVTSAALVAMSIYKAAKA